MDKISFERIASLHPKIRSEVQSLYIIACEQLTGRAKVRIVQGHRSVEEQNRLYNQKPKVTNAKGGQSYHNFGLAIDFALLVDSKLISWDIVKDFDEDGKTDWMEVVKVFTDRGYTWGGNFKSITDKPHLEKSFGYSCKQLMALKKDSEGYPIL